MDHLLNYLKMNLEDNLSKLINFNYNIRFKVKDDKYLGIDNIFFFRENIEP